MHQQTVREFPQRNQWWAEEQYNCDYTVLARNIWRQLHMAGIGQFGLLKLPGSSLISPVSSRWPFTWPSIRDLPLRWAQITQPSTSVGDSMVWRPFSPLPFSNLIWVHPHLPRGQRRQTPLTAVRNVDGPAGLLSRCRTAPPLNGSSLTSTAHRGSWSRLSRTFPGKHSPTMTAQARPQQHDVIEILVS